MQTIKFFFRTLMCIVTFLLRVVFHMLTSFLVALFGSGIYALIAGAIASLLMLLFYGIFQFTLGAHSVFGIIMMMIAAVIGGAIVFVLLALVLLLCITISEGFDKISDYFRNVFEKYLIKLATQIEKM